MASSALHGFLDRFFVSGTKNQAFQPDWFPAVSLVCAGLKNTSRETAVTARVTRLLENKAGVPRQALLSHFLSQLVSVEIGYWKCFHAITIELGVKVNVAIESLLLAAQDRSGRTIQEHFRRDFEKGLGGHMLAGLGDVSWRDSVRHILDPATIEQTAEMARSIVDLIPASSLNDNLRTDVLDALRRLVRPDYRKTERWAEDLQLVMAVLRNRAKVQELLASPAFRQEIRTGRGLSPHFEQFLTHRIEALACCLGFLHALLLVDAWALGGSSPLPTGGKTQTARLIVQLLRTNPPDHIVQKTNVVIMSFAHALGSAQAA